MARRNRALVAVLSRRDARWPASLIRLLIPDAGRGASRRAKLEQRFHTPWVRDLPLRPRQAGLAPRALPGPRFLHPVNRRAWHGALPWQAHRHSCICCHCRRFACHAARGPSLGADGWGVALPADRLHDESLHGASRVQHGAATTSRDPSESGRIRSSAWRPSWSDELQADPESRTKSTADNAVASKRPAITKLPDLATGRRYCAGIQCRRRTRPGSGS